MEEIKEYLKGLGFEEVEENNFQKIIQTQGNVTIVNGRKFEQPGPKRKLNIIYDGEGYIANAGDDGESDDIRQIVHCFSIFDNDEQKISFAVETLDDFGEYI